MKKLLISILAVCLCLTTVFALASCGCEQEDTRVITAKITEPDLVDEMGFGYIIVDSKTLTVTQYKGTATVVEVPSEYDGKPVTAIGSSVFRSSEVSSVTIPSSIESIGERSFSNCQKLTSIVIPEGVKEIQKNAFEFCFNLKSITLPSTLETIGMYCFTGSDLESIEIPENVTALDHFTFYQCTNLKTAKVPATVTEFGKNVFADDENLTIIGTSGSAVEEYAEENDIKFIAE